MSPILLLAQEMEAELGWFDALTALIASPTGRAGAYYALALAALSVGTFLLLPPRGRGLSFWVGTGVTAVAFIMLLVPSLRLLSPWFAFLLLEGLTVLGGIGTITARSPIYSAIWFASALLAIGGILLLSGAQFLGLATVAIYAGAIVVTLLFVLMLAQPEGKAIYDRLGWGWLPTLCATLAGASVTGVVVASILSAFQASPTSAEALRAVVAEAISEAATPQAADSDLRRDPAALRNVQLTTDARGNAVLEVDLAAGSGLLARGDAPLAQAIRQKAGPGLLPPSYRIEILEKDILTPAHVANLGKELFGRHLISIEVTGVLLLAALVGAIAMAIHGKELKVDPHAHGVTLR